MGLEFRKSLPDEMVRNVVALCGEEGERWLNNLPKIIATLEKRWSVEVEPHSVADMSFNFVAFAKGAENSVLKINMPDDADKFGEAEFLKSLNGSGVVRLINEDKEHRAILTERLEPGENLKKVFLGNERKAVDVVIGILKNLLKEPPADKSSAIALDEWFEKCEGGSGDGFPEHYTRKTLQIYRSLSRQPGHTFYLHGDLHHRNVLSSGSSFKAIDPKGMIGHIGYEISVFLNNHHSWVMHRPDAMDILDEAVDRFASAFDIEPIEIRQWAFAQRVLSAWWKFDEMPDLYANEVERADIWNV